jgi:CarD family transcriptional regulator
MQFSIGECIVHPVHGAGEVVNIETRELDSESIECYVIEFKSKRLMLHVPVLRVQELGMRKVMSRKRIESVMQTLSGVPHQLPQNFQERRQKVLAMLNSGVPIQIAEVVRELTWRRTDNKLTQSDQELLVEGRDRLIAEVALATDTSRVEVRRQVDEALAEAVHTGQEESTLAA